jgi:hypothetical protein
MSEVRYSTGLTSGSFESCNPGLSLLRVLHVRYAGLLIIGQGPLELGVICSISANKAEVLQKREVPRLHCLRRNELRVGFGKSKCLLADYTTGPNVAVRGL